MCFFAVEALRVFFAVEALSGFFFAVEALCFFFVLWRPCAFSLLWRPCVFFCCAVEALRVFSLEARFARFRAGFGLGV